MVITLKKEIRSYNTKVIETATTIEIWKYDDPIFSWSNPYDEKEINIKDINLESNLEDISDMEVVKNDNIKVYNSLVRMEKYYTQLRWEIARLVDVNYDEQTKFMTLTFKDNIEDVSYTNKEFSKFIRRLSYYLYKDKKMHLRYIAVWEKQKRGSIHYHVIFFSLPYIPNNKLEEIWGQGFVKINQIDVDSLENRGRYVSKYFSKNVDVKEYKKKSFFKSQNLIQPKIRRFNSSEPVDINNKNIIFSKEYNRKIPEMQDNKIISYRDSKVEYYKIKK